MKPSEIASLLNYRLQNRTKRPNRSTNNGYMAKTAKRCVVSESVSDTLVREKLNF